jgi:TetR/AcrR family transcriptional regulator, repressor of fatR-cypB operon
MKTSVDKGKLTRKQLEKLQHRNEILEAARKLFIEKGFSNTTIDEIAQLAQFGKGTIYNYFANKEVLFQGLIEQFCEENLAIVQATIENGSGSTRDRFRTYLTQLLANHERQESFLMIARESSHENMEQFQNRLEIVHKGISKVWQIMAAKLSTEMESGKFTKGNAIHMAALFDLMARFYGLGAVSKQFPLKRVSHNSIVDLIDTVFFDGIEIKRNTD